MRKLLLKVLRGRKPCSCGKANWEVINGNDDVFVYGLTKQAAEHVAEHLSYKDGGYGLEERYYARRQRHFRSSV